MGRREFLRTVGVGGVSLLGGCSLLSSDEVVLERVVVANLDRWNGHEVDVTVRYDGDAIYDRVHEFDRQEGDRATADVVEDPFPADPGSYVVAAELLGESGSPGRINVGRVRNDDCAAVHVQAFDDTELGISVLENCPSETD